MWWICGFQVLFYLFHIIIIYKMWTVGQKKSRECKILPVAPFSQYSRQINKTTAEKESRGQDILHFLSFSLRFDQSSNQLVDSLLQIMSGQPRVLWMWWHSCCHESKHWFVSWRKLIRRNKYNNVYNLSIFLAENPTFSVPAIEIWWFAVFLCFTEQNKTFEDVMSGCP